MISSSWESASRLRTDRAELQTNLLRHGMSEAQVMAIVNYQTLAGTEHTRHTSTTGAVILGFMMIAGMVLASSAVGRTSPPAAP